MLEGYEIVIVLGAGAALLWLLPKQLPKLMNALGRARGEFKRGQVELEKELK